MSICGGIARTRGRNPNSIFIHNDAGGQGMNANHYNLWLRTHDLASGFAHYYVADDYVLQAEDDGNCAWHCGNGYYNQNALSIEVCQSFGNKDIFLSNEQKALKLAAQKCKQYGIAPSESTIRLHQEVFATACPHRSVELHGGAKATKQYFIAEIEKHIGTTGSVQTAQGLPGISPEEMEAEGMEFVFDIEGVGTVFYFDGQNIKGFAHQDELKLICDIYKANHGKDIVARHYTKKSPWYQRLIEFTTRNPVTSFKDFGL